VKLYIAAAIYNGMHIGGPVYNRLTDVQKQHRKQLEHLLESYHYFNTDKIVEATRRGKEKVFLDSGAFSAWTQGVDIDLRDYCKFIRDNADIVECASVLDSIGNPAKTLENQRAMEQLGVQALPCFHYGEDFSYGQFYADRYEYITLGGMVRVPTPNLIRWLDTVWERLLVDSAGRPRLKVHAFGITSVPVMKRYPWYSVDSSSWVQISSIGAILHPDYGTIQISKTSPARKVENQHFDSMSKLVQDKLTHEFNSLGYTVQELKESYLARRTYCMWAYRELGLRMTQENKTFANEQMGLFA
jgi:hypothetical protein